MPLDESTPIDGDGISTGTKVSELCGVIRTLKKDLNDAGYDVELWEIDGGETQLKAATAIDMQTKKIINLVDPTANQEAATKKYVDDSIIPSLWEIDGAETQLKVADEIDMQTKKIINLVDPAANQDASTKKYTDDEVGAAIGLALALS